MGWNYLDVSTRPKCPVCGQPMLWVSHDVDLDRCTRTSRFSCDADAVTCVVTGPYEAAPGGIER